MDNLDTNPDAMMIVAGLVISLIAVLELYPAWKQAHDDSHGSSVRGDGRSAAEE